jgi:transcriptional regulator with XRE-family HTH domain
MVGIGSRLRAIRQKWGLTLREVAERSVRLSEKYGNPNLRISPSWLARVEQDGHDFSSSKLIVLSYIYHLSSEELLDLCSQGTKSAPNLDAADGPNASLLLTSGPLEEQARTWLPDQILAERTWDKTRLLPSLEFMPNHYRRGIIGNDDLALFPLMKPGTIVLINIHKRKIAHRREWTGEYDRPIYFLETSERFVCAWCSLDRSKTILSLDPHYSSPVMSENWKYRTEVSVVGQVAAVFQRFEGLSANA